ncbi:MAG: pyruvate, phosphate dikinase, partial [Chloroflexi bacterium]|nr:pyruvate, phosphate dikinase [Chloroflexota bacterium]
MTVDGTMKWVYRFEEGSGTPRDLLGGKGAGLAEMTRAGLPVPPGFTITTEACRSYYQRNRQFPPGLWDQTLEALHDVERQTGKRLGDERNPLLVSVRSGAKFSMPGMMDTILNLGLNDQTLRGLAVLTGNDRFANDAYRRFIQMFGRVVLGIDSQLFESILDDVKHQVGAQLDTDLTARDMEIVVRRYKDLVRTLTGRGFPQDPFEQLRMAIEAVFSSWNTRRAIEYRNYHHIPHDLCTAANVVTMVFGNMGNDSGTGVAFTRDPATGEPRLYGEFLTNAQGEDVVAGIRTPRKIDELVEVMPDVDEQLSQIARRLERTYRDAQDIEFTVERGKLYMLQTRAAKRTARSAVRIAVDMVHEGLINRDEALLRVEPNQIYQLLLPGFDPAAKEAAQAEQRLLAKGLNASPGAATGRAIFDADRAVEWAERGERVILVRPETNPDDVHGMLAAAGILTARGGATSHAAVVARGLGKPCVAGAESLNVEPESGQLSVDGIVVREGEEISIDGTTGEIFVGRIATIAPRLEEETELQTLLGWANEVKRLGVWANADYPRDAAIAVSFGAEGIGLCRTEHMFFEEERLPLVRRMILAAGAYKARMEQIDRVRLELDTATGERQAALLTRLHHLEGAAHTAQDVKDYIGSLTRLQEIQRGDFKGIFQAMAGRPVVIRLLDPPLHEFLPRYDDLLVEITELRCRGVGGPELQQKEQLLRVVDSLREANPMLGLRGCRLGILYPEIYEMQVRAILMAAAELVAEDVPVHPEIMIPL